MERVQYAVGVLTVILMSVVAYVMIRRRQWLRRHDEGVRLLGEGNYTQAAGCFQQALLLSPRSRERVAATYHLGLCHYLEGQMARALSILEPLAQVRGTREVPSVHLALPGVLASCLAVEGDTTEARRWLEEARRRMGVELGGFLLLPEVLILCREEHFFAAVRILEDRWKQAEAGGVRDYKLLRLLRAYASSEVVASGDAPVMELLAELHHRPPGEFDFLGTRWPRMKAFLHARGLSSQAHAL